MLINSNLNIMKLLLRGKLVKVVLFYWLTIFLLLVIFMAIRFLVTSFQNQKIAKAYSCGEIVYTLPPFEKQKGINEKNADQKNINCFINAYKTCKVVRLKIAHEAFEYGGHQTYLISKTGESCEIKSFSTGSSMYGNNYKMQICKQIINNEDKIELNNCRDSVFNFFL